MRVLRQLPVALLALFLSVPLRADMVIFNVQADLSSFSGTGALSFNLNSNGAPDFNITAQITNLLFNGGSYDTGTGLPSGDVFRSGSTITFGGSELLRSFDIPVSLFGNSLSFDLALNRAPGGTTDGWTFSFSAFDDQASNFDAILIDYAATGDPVVSPGAGIDAAVVPEPSTWAVLLMASGFVAYRARRR